jgi:hypothetical protein
VDKDNHDLFVPSDGPNAVLLPWNPNTKGTFVKDCGGIFGGGIFGGGIFGVMMKFLDSPELMPLDNNLFAELMDAIRYNMAWTRWLPNDDPRKFRRGTPKEAWHMPKRSWEYGVPSSFIVRDISRLLKSIKAIINTKGCVVHFESRRAGRRSEYHHVLQAPQPRQGEHEEDDGVAAAPGRQGRFRRTHGRFGREPGRRRRGRGGGGGGTGGVVLENAN